MDSVPAGGDTPRQFALNAAGDLVAVGLQYDGAVIVLERNVKTGQISMPEKKAAIAGLGIEATEYGPACIVWDESRH